MGLEFIEDRLDLPTLGVGRSKIDSGGLGGIEDRGEQPERPQRALGPAVIDFVVNNTHHNMFGLQPSVVGSELTQPGPIVEGLEMSGSHVVLRPPNQIGTGPRCLFP